MYPRKLILEIEEHCAITDNHTKIPVTLEVLATLDFLGCGSFQRRVGRDAFCSMSQASISLAINKVCDVVVKHLSPKYVRFPANTAEANIGKNGFQERFGVPGILRLIDGTHIAISHIKKNEEYAYVNRKNFKSINVQAVSR